MEAKIIAHENPDNTGMLHLGEDSSIENRIKNFPIGSIVKIEPAHFFGDICVYRAYLKGEMDYFSENEVMVLSEGIAR